MNNLVVMRKGELVCIYAKSNVGKTKMHTECPYKYIKKETKNVFFRGNGE